MSSSDCRRRGASWVRSAIEVPPPVAAVEDKSELAVAMEALPVPVDLMLEPEGPDAHDPGDDTIRAVNLSNPVAFSDLSKEARATVRGAQRAARLPSSRTTLVELRHFLGGPTANTNCTVLLPIGGEDGAPPPLPYGFRPLAGLGVAVGTDLSAAFRVLAHFRETKAPAAEALAPPPKRRRRDLMHQRVHALTPSLPGVAVVSPSSPSPGPPLAQPVSSCPLQGEPSPRVLDCADSRSSEEGSVENPENAGDEDEPCGAVTDSVSDDDDAGSGQCAGELAGLLEDSASESSSGSSEVGPLDGPDDMVVSVAAENMLAVDLRRYREHHSEAASAPQASSDSSAANAGRPLLVFWGEARWQRTQLLSELARGDWGLCAAARADFVELGTAGSARPWQRLTLEESRPIQAPRTEMSRVLPTGARQQQREFTVLGRLVAAHQEATRQQTPQHDPSP